MSSENFETKGNRVYLATFNKWDKEKNIKKIFGYKTSNEDGCTYVTEVWCKICAANKDSFGNHPNLKGPVLESAQRFIKGTNNVNKSALERHLTGKAHEIAMSMDDTSTASSSRQVRILYYFIA